MIKTPRTYDKISGVTASVATLLFWKHKILLAKRLSKHYNGYYGVPGGKIDPGESPIECSSRETREETSLETKNVRLLSFIASHMKGGTHNICLWCCASVNKPMDWNGVVDYIEKDKHGDPKTEAWQWYTREQIEDMKLMPSVKAAWDYYINRPGVPYAGMFHEI